MSKGFALPALLAGALLLACPPGAGADIFVHRAADGSLHFSDRPKDDRWTPYGQQDETQPPRLEMELDHLKLGAYLERLEKRYHIDANLIRAMIKVESNFNPLAVSRKGAMGLMQIMPSTAEFLSLDDPYDPYQNVEAGVRYMRYLLRRFGGHMIHAIAAYNAGPKAVENYGAVPPYPETTNYVRQVILYYRAYAGQGGPVEPAKVPGPVAVRTSEDAS